MKNKNIYNKITNYLILIPLIILLSGCGALQDQTPITSFQLYPSSLSMEKRTTATLNVSILPAESPQQVNWHSSRPSVAAVSDTGLITAMNLGTTLITATAAADSTQVATCMVTVKPKYTLIFDTQGDELIPSQTIIEGELATTPSIPPRTGCYCEGWFKESDCINPWIFDTDIVTRNTTIYAKWSLLEFTYIAADYYTNEIAITGYTGTDTDVVIPSTINGKPVIAIEYWAFWNKDSIISVTIPNSVINIRRCAFSDCSNLTEIHILAINPPTLRIDAFSYCYSLNAIIVPAAAVDAYKTAPVWSSYASIIESEE